MLFFVATIKSFQIGCHMVHILLLLGLFVQQLCVVLSRGKVKANR